MLNCPVSNTHKRLNRSHRLWHSTIDVYQHPEDFITNLNSTIQELRHLTFILQSEKSSISDFDNWYSHWQEKMKNDPKMKWLHASRTKIVHQEDLETQSIAEATILTYNDYPFAKIKSPVMLPNEIIMDVILKNEIEKIKQDKDLLVLTIQRRWIIPEFPDEDITEILAYCFQFLNKMLASLHEYLKVPITKCSITDFEVIPDLNALPLCMTTTDKISNASFKLSTKQKLTPQIKDLHLTQKEMQKVSKRYKFLKDIKENIEKNAHKNEFDIAVRAKEAIEIAKRILEVDKHHISIAFLLDADGKDIGIETIMPEDQSDKYLLMRKLSDRVKELDAKMIIFISESWIAPMETVKGQIIRPKDSDKRKEALTVAGITNKGEKIFLVSVFKRGLLGRISFEETQTLEDHEPSFLYPILKLWGVPTDDNAP